MPHPLEVCCGVRRTDGVGLGEAGAAGCLSDPAGVAPAAPEDGDVDREGCPCDAGASGCGIDPAGVAPAVPADGGVDGGDCPCVVAPLGGSVLPPPDGRCREGGALLKLVLVRGAVRAST
jgi:hypothetical protein